ncbi:UDP-glucose 4-epimerase GalE [Stackebrandtia nassauensis]|uniref:UDP-glucose 4-epimerase n=1 Tax=Stackebrandtia nassauensis (strain DSM 44728 / CIP 108903 / NRRL B-16338 / NBRC 102104 / LLR-40K-21) TaxID=446470 RepID=D3Q8Z5_STANL|nr:UDP-glucose 4-epimerase GalE [Stackebrandtia nassauensis]ADD40604.1 UDP-glucose 4-epimerase [Stackebrandtia nassauensis DSM 44728]
MKYLVTGGAGYVGSVVATMLLEAGHEVVVLDDLSTNGDTGIPAGATVVRGRIHEAAEVLDDSFDGVLHFAGYIANGESMAKPDIYWDVNVVGTLSLLNAMHAAGVRSLVFSSSASVYGNPSELPATENAITRPTSTYGANKLAADYAITNYCTAFDIAAVSLRYFNVAGAWKDASGVWHGERHDPETHLIPLILAAANGDRGALKLYGEDYDTPDGTCVRDYIHVADLARAHLLALANQQPGEHQIYNLGNGNGFSNREVIAAVERVTGLTVPFKPAPRRPGDPDTLVASSAKAAAELGWRPEKPSLDDIIADAWEFYRHG